jgi:nitrogen regulatory protein P-II 1
MKHIIAFIKDHKLDQVSHALHEVDGLTGMTASSVRGFGRTRREVRLSRVLRATRRHAPD